MVKLIEKKDIKGLLKEISKDGDTYVPQRNLGGDIWIEALPKEEKAFDIALERVALADEDVIISPKDIFFPQVETMFEFGNGDIRETVEPSAKILFGIKACDLQGILFVDDFFKRNYEDIYYLSRMKERFVVVIGCLNPPRPDACFCASADTGPFAEKGFDWQFIDLGDSYVVEVGSEKGKQFLDKYTDFFKDASDDAGETARKIKSKAADSLELKVSFKEALELMGQDDFTPEENYKRVGERCVYCGACLYVCPTCTCFNVFDNVKDERGERCRNWDGCVFAGYTREASGHNPRKEKWLRTSRRYEHKLKYDCKTAGRSGCVGCGRCLASCPVNIGISKFIQEITEKRKVM